MTVGLYDLSEVMYHIIINEECLGVFRTLSSFIWHISYLIPCVLVRPGPRPAGTAVGGGERQDRRSGPSAEAAAAEHRPAAAHLSAGQADPGTGAQSLWPANIQ